MTTQNNKYLKKLFNILVPGTVVTSSWLESFGISKNLKDYYLEAGWLESIGRGAYKNPNDKVEWYGAINAIQKQTKIKVHLGGLSALAQQGFSHYFRLDKETLQLFSPRQNNLPKWFSDYDWRVNILHKKTSFLFNNIGLKEIDIKQKLITVSSPERAIMECLYLAPTQIDLVECYHIFEGLVNLKPKLVKELLLNCNSVKVKRLFLFMADKSNHDWFQFLDTKDIDLGSGKRMISKNAVYHSKYHISIPKELMEL